MWHDPAINHIFYTWVSELGDNHVLPWVNTVLYGVAFIAAVRRLAGLNGIDAPLKERRFWLFLMLVLFVLGVNKQMDFQTLLIEVGRYVAKRDGWLEKRRLIQSWFAYALTGAVGCGVLVIIAAMGRHLKRNGVAALGLALLCAYVLLRAASTSHLGPSTDLLGIARFRLTDIIELAGIVCILANALPRPRPG